MPRHFSRVPLFLALTAALAPLSVSAAALPAEPPADHTHDAVDLDAVQVRGTLLPATAEELVRPVEVLAGERLDEAKASSLGETVGRLPGVQSSYFGPGVGRPIIRGLEGARVQVLSDGLGSGDVSTVSADHAVSIEPFLADQIEVLKGPATLLYGSGAIGGAVNVIDGRVPETLTDQPLQGRAEVRGGTVNDERTGMVRVDATAQGRFVLHADALHRETGDYAIPGNARSDALLARDGLEPDPADREVLRNSALRTDSAALGLSWIGTRGFVGLGTSLFDTRYGVPGEEDVNIEMDQRRHELRAGLDDLGPLASARLRYGQTRYTHRELEGGEVGTVFLNDSRELRLELTHRPLGGWSGAFGLQWSDRDFIAIGAEAFVPGTRGRQGGLFWLGERGFGPLKLELGARGGRDTVATGPEPRAPGRLSTRRFDTASASAALRWNLSPDLHVSLGLDHAERAPTAEELYSNGLHVATQAIEVGDDRLGAEKANRVELGAHWHTGPVELGLSAYSMRYSDFIYLAALEPAAAPGSPLLLDGTAVNHWTQEDARFTGFEAEATWAIADNATGAWTLRLFGDRVRGRLAGEGTRDVALRVFEGDSTVDVDGRTRRGGNLPRIAPGRAGGEMRWTRGPWRASLGAVRTLRQDRVAAGERATPGYTLVDAHLAWHRDTAGDNAWELFLDGSNLLDREARPHTSFLKDVAPLPGRGVAFGVRMFF